MLTKRDSSYWLNCEREIDTVYISVTLWGKCFGVWSIEQLSVIVLSSSDANVINNVYFISRASERKLLKIVL